MVLELYEDTLERVVYSDVVRDEDGDYHKAEPVFTDLTECDAVPSGSANTITFPDGTKGRYSYVVYLPKSCCHRYRFGESVRLTRHGVTGIYEVKGFHEYQLQKKLYI